MTRPNTDHPAHPAPLRRAGWSRGRPVTNLFLILLAAADLSSFGAVVPSPEQLLPEDTMVLVTVPDFPKLAAAWGASAQGRFLADPAMKPFTDQLQNKWRERVAQLLEQEFGLNLSDCASLAKGQITIAITRNIRPGETNSVPGFLLLLDAGDKKRQLTATLKSLRRRWADSGKTSRTETSQGVTFLMLSIPTNRPPGTFRRLFPVPETGEPAPGIVQGGASTSGEFTFAQVDSLLLAGTCRKTLEEVVAKLHGNKGPVLADLPAYRVGRADLIREAPLFGWLNTKLLLEGLFAQPAAKPAGAGSQGPVDIPRNKIFTALGLSSLRSLAFACAASADGTMVQLSVTAPEPDRQGLVKLLAGEAKETSAPAFVPADIQKFRRWRVDARKGWRTLQTTFDEMSPRFSSVMSFILDSANTYARQKDPAFDIRTNLLGNLGDDFISLTGTLPAPSAPASNSAASLLLVGSPNPDELASSLKGILIFFSEQASTPPQEREYAGHKIFSLPLAASALSLGLGSATPAGGASPALHYAASGGYVALATSPSAIEGYIRLGQDQSAPLRDVPGFKEAMQKVAGPGSTLAGYENQLESARLLFDDLRNRSTVGTNSSLKAASALVPGLAPWIAPATSAGSWADFSLLPPFEKVSNYFSFVVYGMAPSTNGLAVRLFAPTPPRLK